MIMEDIIEVCKFIWFNGIFNYFLGKVRKLEVIEG